MSNVKDHPDFNNFRQVADHAYIKCLLSSELDPAYGTEITRSIATIFKATGAFPVVNSDVTVYKGRSMSIHAIAYMLFDEDVVVTFGVGDSN
jgi:hypothetical protein